MDKSNTEPSNFDFLPPPSKTAVKASRVHLSESAAVGYWRIYRAY